MEQLTFTKFLNHLFGPAVTALLEAAAAFIRHHPTHPITNPLAMELLVVIVLTILFVAVRMRLSVEKPGAIAAHDGRAFTASSKV
jgi:F-type H+-transporting ATPase subunit a